MKFFLVDTDLFIGNDKVQVGSYFEKIYNRPRNSKYNDDIIEVSDTDNNKIFVTDKYSNEVEQTVYETLLSQGYKPKTMFFDLDDKKENPLNCIEISITELMPIIQNKIQLPCVICRTINWHLSMFEYNPYK